MLFKVKTIVLILDLLQEHRNNHLGIICNFNSVEGLHKIHNYKYKDYSNYCNYDLYNQWLLDVLNLNSP